MGLHILPSRRHPQKAALVRLLLPSECGSLSAFSGMVILQTGEHGSRASRGRGRRGRRLEQGELGPFLGTDKRGFPQWNLPESSILKPISSATHN